MPPPQPLNRSAIVTPLSFTDPPQSLHLATQPITIREGWVLKKRRKRMQGFARRYFHLHQSGLLSYSFEPGHPARDQINLHSAAISTAPGRKDIHIDSNTATFHIKCLTTEDFNKWMTAFRKFIAPDDRTVGRRSSLGRGLPIIHYLNKAGHIADEIGSTLSELEDAVQLWAQDDWKRRTPVSPKFKPEKERNHKESKEAGSVFGIFKKSASNHNHNHQGPISEDGRTSDTSSQSASSPQQRVQAAIETLKSHQSALLKSLSAIPFSDPGGTSTVRSSPLPSTAEEDQDQDEYVTPTRTHHPSSLPWGHVKRTSIAETMSDGTGSIWFDAQEPEMDGAEEFILDNDATPYDEGGQGSKLSTSESQRSADQDTEFSGDTDSEDEVELELEKSSENSSMNVLDHAEVQRRAQLPSRPVGDEGSLFAVLKKNVGKDLSSVALPVSFNEPLTLLQRAAEEVEYYDLLNQAAQATDPVERLSFVAAFAVSSYSHTRHRSGRKGFNPLLAETFEDVRTKFVAEKVSHQPVVMAYHAEGDDWELHATSSGKTKFWGKSLEIIPLGVTRLQIGNDHYEWKKPSSFMRNIMMGTKYLEHCGKMVIENTRDGARCVLDFKESGYWASSNLVSGTILSHSGEVQCQLEGKWDDHFAQKLDSSHLRVLWRVSPFPKNAPEYYGFTSYGITLNEITPDLQGRLPPTDSRLRPDVRALEEGDIDLAEEEKLRVEEVQRERRRQGVERQPRWFRQIGEEWVYVGGYWEERARGWKTIEALW
ncbi:hypothetical protein JAAARDRAFT_29892 [Jaapia argillacea MUCL 33604]|uniref:PH domain-containing protein n=1 Tax=Jaapia argillacea MUCL 33604 TaxID=933084 RepID=A0A067QCG7_9AGAM|nr:hypothetical protein JAAARDRAFT_29892 [Jaapia argillacea MUCL 33604]